MTLLGGRLGHLYEEQIKLKAELRSCVKVEVAVLDSCP